MAATVSYWFTVGVCASHLMRYLVCVLDRMGFDGQKKSPRWAGWGIIRAGGSLIYRQHGHLGRVYLRC